jgi:integrase
MARKRRRGRGEGAVFYSDSKGCWVARVEAGKKPDGRPHFKEVTAQTKDKVLKKRSEEEEKVRQGIPAEVGKLTTGQYLTHWLNTAKPSVERGTWASYERCVRLHLLPRIGGILLAQLRPMHVEALFAALQTDGVSGGNAKKVSEVLGTALERAVATGVVRSNPAAHVAKPKPAPEPIVPFTADDVLRVRLAVMGHRLEALFALAISTGAREGELLGLGWEHLDLDAGTVHFQRSLDQSTEGFRLKPPKTERGRRVVDVPKFAVAALAEHRKAMLKEGHASGTVVFCTRTGHFMSKSSFVRQVYAPLLKRAEVHYRKFHTFRHTHVSELLSRGVSVVEVARRIGDRPDVILKTYAHWIPGAGKQIATRLEEMYG